MIVALSGLFSYIFFPISFEKISGLNSYFIHRYIIIKSKSLKLG